MSEAIVVTGDARDARRAPRALRPLRSLRIGGLSLSGALSLAAVLAVLLVVSVPRFHGLALQENEADAKATAALLARALDAGGPAPTLRDLLRRKDLAGLRADAELLAQGKLLRRHGYLFEVTQVAPTWTVAGLPLGLVAGQADALAPVRAIRAWPWRHGATGRTAFLVTADGAQLAHTNSEGWQGDEAAGLALASLEGWRPVR
jgi:hypothetical protein